MEVSPDIVGKTVGELPLYQKGIMQEAALRINGSIIISRSGVLAPPGHPARVKSEKSNKKIQISLP
jgi:hypothetical protein